MALGAAAGRPLVIGFDDGRVVVGEPAGSGWHDLMLPRRARGGVLSRWLGVGPWVVTGSRPFVFDRAGAVGRRGFGIGSKGMDEGVGCDRVAGRDRFRAARAVLRARSEAGTGRNVNGLIGSRGLVGGRSRSVSLSGAAADRCSGLAELIGFDLGDLDWWRVPGSEGVEGDRFCAAPVGGRGCKGDRFRSRLVVGTRLRRCRPRSVLRGRGRWLGAGVDRTRSVLRGRGRGRWPGAGVDRFRSRLVLGFWLGRCRTRSVFVERVAREAACSGSVRVHSAPSPASCWSVVVALFDRSCDRDLAVVAPPLGDYPRGGEASWLSAPRFSGDCPKVSSGRLLSTSSSEAAVLIGVGFGLRLIFDRSPLVGIALRIAQYDGVGLHLVFFGTPALGDCSAYEVPFVRRRPGSRGSPCLGSFPGFRSSVVVAPAVGDCPLEAILPRRRRWRFPVRAWGARESCDWRWQ